MADPPHSYPDLGDDTGAHPERGPTTGTPRWVKVFGVVLVILVLLFVIVMLLPGGGHGPGRHASLSDQPPSSVAGDQALPRSSYW